MEEDKLSFLRDDKGRFASSVADTQPAPEASVAPPASPPPPQDAPAPATAPTPEAASVQPASVQPPPGYIPIAAVLDEREKRQKFERELEDYRRKYEEATKQPPAPLDPIADPEAFELALQNRIQQVEWNAITTVSLASARRVHGEDKVQQAEAWVQQELARNPHFFQAIRRQPDPYDFVVREHQRSLKMSKIGDEDPETWAEKWAQANGYVKAPTPQAAAGTSAPSPQTAPLPRPSLASAPSAASKPSTVPQGPGAAFDAVFR